MHEYEQAYKTIRNTGCSKKVDPLKFKLFLTYCINLTALTDFNSSSQKHKVLYTWVFDESLLFSHVYKTLCFCESLIQSIQSCHINTIHRKSFEFERVYFFFIYPV